MAPDDLRDLIARSAATIAAHEEELTSLDRAIGDGDHGANMKRGFSAVAEQADALAGLPLGEALQKAGMTLIMKVGGASGPLYGSLLMAMGKALPDGGPADLAGVAAMLAAGVEAVKARGKSDAGAKTMLDVLVPLARALQSADAGTAAAAAIATARRTADEALAATRDMKATKGRASFLGERSIGHLDPGARSSALLVHAACDFLEDRS
ncbi:dihydroxyacetone kinase DhaL subunit [Tistlia consotensis]|uniref:Dihydroxyacetone kinase DhaL subunit n=1 Tax=Tistlia consotensis USBA 355 TaxID=560819 RepID=A0A1Y6CBX1_9PROT|nr:dihydroxyacetone kinase subunit DhaL [Tistlia consotensis]SMF55196.1 dihydroxyacetone kinase DhaL subunit [Tistlia consotensis USBA 355]SNR87881.1 dihydroxyacetone kinase DhaL subunit [Tistlia consotensis]